MNRKKKLLKKTSNQLLKRYQAQTKLMIPRVLRVMAPAKLMMERST
jgi:hypothetical protein